MKPNLALTLLAAVCTATGAHSQVELTANTPAVDKMFGWSVDTDGSTTVVGAWAYDGPGCPDEGAVYVFQWTGSTWVQQALLQSPASCGSAFGESVAVQGDTIVVGADYANGGTGAAYVFQRTGGVWPATPTQILLPANLQLDDDFGNIVAIDGDTLAVSSPGANRGGFGCSGSVYVYVKNGPTWVLQQQVTPSMPGEGANFGYAGVSLDGDNLAVGMPYRLDVCGTTAVPGEVYVFVRSAGTWSQQGRLFAAMPGAKDWFGFRVCIEGDLLVASSPQVLLNGTGSVSFFERTGTVWGLPTLVPSAGSQPGDVLGTGLHLDGGRLAIGAPGDDGAAGSVYIYDYQAGTWNAGCQLRACDGLFGDLMGISVSLSGQRLVAGATDHLHAGSFANGVGAAYTFDLSGANPVVYCTSGTSASGCQATLSTAGLPSASTPSGFDLVASGVEGAKDGLFFFGTNGCQANPWGNGTSYQCVVPPVKRAGLLQGSGTAGLCDGGFVQDLNAYWCAACPKAHKNPGAGAVVQAQLWYRDPLSTSNQTTSLSDAIEFCVGP